ncbi:SH3 domain-containing protein [Exiguobacterium flavidum]|uniref:SH3 domain-containing protein n=1 Tax=Exiguobacterium flavidum TaxID=2184695 RepID=UPI000DF759CE|nr:SH3 domain-containing protein [Exiguobacterium flavidum]
MIKKRGIVGILTIMLAGTGIVPAEAAETRVAYVGANVLNIRKDKETSAPIVGTLKKYSRLVVYSDQGGWSEIRYDGQKAYVMTNYIRPMTSFLMDTDKHYVYRVDGKVELHRHTGRDDVWYKWTVDKRWTYAVTETGKGLYWGLPESEYAIVLSYPLKKGKAWASGPYGNGTSVILGVNQTMKTKAGTFKGVVTVKTPTNYVVSYAPNVGEIKSVKDGKVKAELISLMNR